ncbi:MAG TPA: dienelactone hydrolase family protein [Gemmataceae bacterium]|nr:dienelactone hydrolase family protein [Gemmataceae bacterium]
MTRFVAAIGVAVLAAGVSPAAVKTETIEYEFGGTKMRGFLAFDDTTKEKKPGVLVVHEWWGLNDYAKDRARQLAELGYVAFAADLYGDAKLVTTQDEARDQATALRKDAKVWRGRAEAALKVLATRPEVDATKLAAMGYCLGGSTALQLAYAGADLKAVATFHAALPTPTEAEAKAIKPRIAVFHGEADKFIPEKSIADFRAALDKAGVKYTFESYPGVVHSFTTKDADKVGNPGMKYDKNADEKSWAGMKELFKATLGK